MAKGKYQEWLTKEGLLLIEGCARDGLTDEQIARNMGIAVKTLYNWKNSHMPILQALKKGKEVVDREVENALLKCALGYQYEEVTYEMGVEVKRVRKEVTPDTTAQIFWLKNRKRAEWRDKQEVEHSGEMTQNVNATVEVDYKKYTLEELKQLEALAAKLTQSE
jgi:transcriptional regulator with XRE-family HTH domain